MPDGTILRTTVLRGPFHLTISSPDINDNGRVRVSANNVKPVTLSATIPLPELNRGQHNWMITMGAVNVSRHNHSLSISGLTDVVLIHIDQAELSKSNPMTGIESAYVKNVPDEIVFRADAKLFGTKSSIFCRKRRPAETGSQQSRKQRNIDGKSAQPEVRRLLSVSS